jgi:hypothetical protein
MSTSEKPTNCCWSKNNNNNNNNNDDDDDDDDVIIIIIIIIIIIWVSIDSLSSVSGKQIMTRKKRNATINNRKGI